MEKPKDNNQNDEVYLIDALEKYAEVMNELLSEMGVDSRNYTREDLHDFARTGFAEFQKIYDEFVLWVVYGNDKKAQTKAMLRAMRNKKGRLY